MYHRTILFMLTLIVFGLMLTKGLEFIKGYDLITKKDRSPPVELATPDNYEYKEEIKPEPKVEEELEYYLPKFEQEFKSADRWESLFNPHDIIEGWPMINGIPVNEVTMIIAFGNPKIDWSKSLGQNIDPDELPIPEGEEFNALYCLFIMGVNEDLKEEIWLMGYVYYKGEISHVYMLDEEKEVYKLFAEENSGDLGGLESCYISV